MKKISILVDCCGNCIFCNRERKPSCMYPVAMVNGDPVRILNPNVLMDTCPLMDETPQDRLPASIYSEIDKHGKLDIVIATD